MAATLPTAAGRSVQPEPAGARGCVQRGPTFIFDAAEEQVDRSLLAHRRMAAPALAVLARAAVEPSATGRAGCSALLGGPVCAALCCVDSAMCDTCPMLCTSSTIRAGTRVAALLNMWVLERSRFFVQVALLKSADRPGRQPSCRGQEAACGTFFPAGSLRFALLLNEALYTIFHALRTPCTRCSFTSSCCPDRSIPGASCMQAPTAQEGRGRA